MAQDILRALLDSLQDDAPVRELLVGAHMVAVCSRRCGLAATTVEPGTHHGPVRDAGRQHLKSARELAQYARSSHPVERSLGVAAINSLLAPWGRTVDSNGSQILIERGRGRRVALVGHFPFVTRLREHLASLDVLELRPQPGDVPAAAAPEILPKADVVGITASALVNGTLDGLLSLCRRDALVVLIGPTTPFSPLLFERGVKILSGAEVTDERAVLRCLGQGAHFRQFEGTRMLLMEAS